MSIQRHLRPPAYAIIFGRLHWPSGAARDQSRRQSDRSGGHRSCDAHKVSTRHEAKNAIDKDINGAQQLRKLPTIRWSPHGSRRWQSAGSSGKVGATRLLINTWESIVMTTVHEVISARQRDDKRACLDHERRERMRVALFDTNRQLVTVTYEVTEGVHRMWRTTWCTANNIPQSSKGGALFSIDGEELSKQHVLVWGYPRKV